jgi:hypothetical protein
MNFNRPSDGAVDTSTSSELSETNRRIDQRYACLPSEFDANANANVCPMFADQDLYATIKRTKLDDDFVLSVNEHLDRLKANIYKDLIRRETLPQPVGQHARHVLALLRSICKSAYEQAVELVDERAVVRRAALNVMAAIDHILHMNFPASNDRSRHVSRCQSPVDRHR